MQKHTFNIFPEMVGEDYQRLKSEIVSSGYDSRYPIYMYEGKILDGWNRYKICNELEIEPVFKEFEGSESEALGFVMRSNKRRNLTSSQWATIAIENTELVEKLKEQAREREAQGKKLPRVEKGRTSEKLAEIFNTNKEYIKQVSKIKNEDPEGFESIKSGKKTISEYKREDNLRKRQELYKTENNEIGELKLCVYDGNMFYESAVYSESRFGDRLMSMSDETYGTVTTIDRFFNRDSMTEISLRDYARIQTFPDSFKFVGTPEKIKAQIGNAVAPYMGSYIAKKLNGKTCGDLFAGCGGFSQGVHSNGIKSKWAIEWELEPCLTYKANFPEAKVFNTNIKSLNPRDFERVDIIIGGPPCQGFSVANANNKGTRTFKSDPRNELYREFLRFVEYLRPEGFIMENVRQIEDVKEEIIKDFEDIGYDVETELVKGNDIGMKQNRVRFFFVGKLRG